MIAALILVVSVAALLQFFVSYCRSVIAAYSKQGLSEHGREVAGIENRNVRSEDFHRLVQLVGLCPGPGDDRNDIRAVRAYYGLLRLVASMFRNLAPPAAFWAERERQGCAYFAAVALDRRISYNRGLMAQQMANRL